VLCCPGPSPSRPTVTCAWLSRPIRTSKGGHSPDSPGAAAGRCPWPDSGPGVRTPTARWSPNQSRSAWRIPPGSGATDLPASCKSRAASENRRMSRQFVKACTNALRSIPACLIAIDGQAWAPLLLGKLRKNLRSSPFPHRGFAQPTSSSFVRPVTGGRMLPTFPPVTGGNHHEPILVPPFR
jgi:hypothetical protein